MTQDVRPDPGSIDPENTVDAEPYRRQCFVFRPRSGLLFLYFL